MKVKEFKKVLVANRGEIGVRIIHTLKEMGIYGVAVYTKEDKKSLHVSIADEAYPLDTYLDIDNLLELAYKLKVDAIHPGYGFLSQNPFLWEKASEKGITIIGPKYENLILAKNKIEIKRLVKEAKIPVVDGPLSPLSDYKEAKRYAEEIGYPIIIKPVKGENGKGIKIVKYESELENSFETCKKEAQTLFGDETLFIEKYIDNVKEIEFQIISDLYGNIVNLFDRDTSLQKDGRKIIIEAPSFGLSQYLREKMGEDLLKIVNLCSYSSVGTVKFLLDSQGNYYFIKLEPGLNANYAITEVITGVDLIREQVLSSMGYPLSFSQKDISIRGDALECRILAEDIHQNFKQSFGQIDFLHFPSGNGVRIDTHIRLGAQIEKNYDLLIAKVISYGKDREISINKMLWILKEMKIGGIKTITPFLITILNNQNFKLGNITTSFIKSLLKNLDILSISYEKEYQLVSALTDFFHRKVNRPTLETNNIKIDEGKEWITTGRNRDIILNII